MFEVHAARNRRISTARAGDRPAAADRGGCVGRGGWRFSSGSVDASREPVQAALGDQALVDGAQAALEGRPDRRAERDGLAVHRAAGADHEVGEAISDCASIARSGTMKPPAAQLGALLGRARQHDGLHLSRRRASTSAKSVVLEAVVQRDRRAACARRRSAARRRGPARRAPPGRARSPRGSTPPSGPGSDAACRARRSAYSRSGGIASGTTTACARRQLTLCWTFAHS